MSEFNTNIFTNETQKVIFNPEIQIQGYATFKSVFPGNTQHQNDVKLRLTLC